MKKSDIQKIRIDIRSDNKSALSLLMDKQGMIKRQGNGVLPIIETEVIATTTGDFFTQLVALVDENIMPFADVYDHPNKLGTLLTISTVFMGKNDTVKAFEFRLGTETKDVGDLFPFFDHFIAQAIHITQEWYEIEIKTLSNQ
ncbi:MAG TPA: hypothetical protein EYG68_11075 [Leucothrix mucor]|nr:hypothetical protein [Leucothrix mucor]